MLAARYETEGTDPWAIHVVEMDDPVPGPGDVLVAVSVSGVNPTDWRSRAPGGATSRGWDWVVPHHDGAGEIVAVGEGVSAARVGERVWLWLAQWQRNMGTAAQLVALPSEQAVALPVGAALELGAGLGIPAIAAHRCLFASGLIEGTAVLVHGGAGAVGHAAIELARWGGARVAATVSTPEKAALAEAAGAELTIDYRNEDVEARVREWAPEGVSRIVEFDAANIRGDAATLAPGGTIACFNAMRFDGVPRALVFKNAFLLMVVVYTLPEEAKRAAVADISKALEAGALSALPLHRFGLDEVSAAHEAVEGGAVGKVIVDVPGYLGDDSS